MTHVAESFSPSSHRLESPGFIGAVAGAQPFGVGTVTEEALTAEGITMATVPAEALTPGPGATEALMPATGGAEASVTGAVAAEVPAAVPCDGFMRNNLGHYVPAALVAERDKLEDQLVRGIASIFLRERERLAEIKRTTLADLHAFRELCAERWGVTLGGRKGNLTFSSYDGTCRVSLSVAEVLKFNTDLEVAETLISECVREWTRDSRAEVQALIDRAFRRNGDGDISTAAVLELRTLKIDDPRWEKAMHIISESLRVVATKDYVRVHMRDANGSWEHVSLNAASV